MQFKRLKRLGKKLHETRKKLMDHAVTERVMAEVGDDDKPKILTADITMISGCQDKQTSADVSCVSNFQIPDAAGRAGGACTSALLKILYNDHKTPEKTMSFIEVLDEMRDMLKKKSFGQIPQLSSTRELDMSHKFELVPDGFEGTRRAVMVGINYTGHNPGELRGCHNDALNMKSYIMNVHGFQDENIHVLMDDGKHEEPTKKNMVAAFEKVVADSKAGDTIYLHFSGHGVRVPDVSGDEKDGYDEALAPLDYKDKGMILDDDLYEIFVNGLPVGVHVVALMDCCHSGSIMDLPFIFQDDGEHEGTPLMMLDDMFDWKKFGGKYGDQIITILNQFLKA